jgi:hypothetical protein
VYTATFVVLPQLFMCRCLCALCVRGIAVQRITGKHAHKACFVAHCSVRSEVMQGNAEQTRRILSAELERSVPCCNEIATFVSHISETGEVVQFENSYQIISNAQVLGASRSRYDFVEVENPNSTSFTFIRPLWIVVHSGFIQHDSLHPETQFYCITIEIWVRRCGQSEWWNNSLYWSVSKDS